MHGIPPYIAASPPSGVTAVQAGPTSIMVSWTPPSPLGDTSGYRIYYTRAGGSSVSVDIEQEAVVSVWILMVETLTATL